MIAYQIFAQIFNNKVMHVGPAENYTDADRVAKIVFGDEAFAIECTQYTCQVGDEFIDGFFYHVDENGDRKQLEYIPTERQQIENLKAENEQLILVLADLIGGGTNE